MDVVCEMCNSLEKSVKHILQSITFQMLIQESVRHEFEFLVAKYTLFFISLCKGDKWEKVAKLNFEKDSVSCVIFCPASKLRF